MCFSAPVSFAAAALLIPVGVYTLRLAWQSDRRLLGLAAFPLFFGVQQFIEGVLWLNLGGFYAEYTQASALGFLFFVYLFWPVFVPLAARALDERPLPRRVLLGLALVAGVLGLLLYISLLRGQAELNVSIVQHSIFYQHRPLFDLYLGDWVVRTLYALVVTLPLLASNTIALRIFGALIALSLGLSALYFDHAFTSVWCFFAAILSLVLMRLLHAGAKQPSVGLISSPSRISEAS
jgi:hypothetical protein